MHTPNIEVNDTVNNPKGDFRLLKKYVSRARLNQIPNLKARNGKEKLDKGLASFKPIFNPINVSTMSTAESVKPVKVSL